MIRRPLRSTPTDTPFPSPTLFRSALHGLRRHGGLSVPRACGLGAFGAWHQPRRGQRHRREQIQLARPALGYEFDPERLFAPLQGAAGGNGGRGRSEEHTSELQSLMRISYAVFCLKKTTTNIKL